MKEYKDRTGTLPLGIVLHKSSSFDEAEEEGFEDAFRNVPVIEAVALVQSDFRLVRFGSYPPKRGTLCVVNDDARFLFTTGFMPEWETYPGPHVPTPIEIKSPREIDIDRSNGAYADQLEYGQYYRGGNLLPCRFQDESAALWPK